MIKSFIAAFQGTLLGILFTIPFWVAMLELARSLP